MNIKLGFLFPGQGAQYVGMGKDLLEAFPETAAIYHEAESILGYSIRTICFDGPEERLTETIHAQPAIFVTSAVCLHILKQKFPQCRPDFSAGLSLGEFTALYAAGSLSFEAALNLVRRRATAMERCAKIEQGTMASVLGLTEEACEAIAREAGCQVANLNSPDQFVLSGTLSSIDRACTLADERGAKRAMKLKVGGAFHSPLMKEAKADLEDALKETPIQKPGCLFIPNASKGAFESHPEKIRHLLAEQLTHPVHWISTMQSAKEHGIQQFLEIGPGRVLKGLARKCDKSLEVESCGTVLDFQNLTSIFQKTAV